MKSKNIGGAVIKLNNAINNNSRFLIETYDTHKQGSLKPFYKPLDKIGLPLIKKNIALNRDKLITYKQQFPLQNYFHPFHFNKSTRLEYRLQGLILNTSLNREKKRYFFTIDLGTKYKTVLSTKNILSFSSLENKTYGSVNFIKENYIYILPSLINKYKSYLKINNYINHKGNAISGLPGSGDASYNLLNYRLNFTRKQKSSFLSSDNFVSKFNESDKFVNLQQRSPDSSIFGVLSGTAYSSFFVNSYNQVSRVYYTHKFFRYYFLLSLRRKLGNKKFHNFGNFFTTLVNDKGNFNRVIVKSLNNNFYAYLNVRLLSIFNNSNLYNLKINKSTYLISAYLFGAKLVKKFSGLINNVLNLSQLLNIICISSLKNLKTNKIYNLKNTTVGLYEKYDFFIKPGKKSYLYKRWFVESNQKLRGYLFSSISRPHFEHPVSLITLDEGDVFDTNNPKILPKIKKIILVLLRKLYTYLLKRSFLSVGNVNSKLFYWFTFFQKIMDIFYLSQGISDSYVNLLFGKKSIVDCIKFDKSLIINKAIRNYPKYKMKNKNIKFNLNCQINNINHYFDLIQKSDYTDLNDERKEKLSYAKKFVPSVYLINEEHSVINIKKKQIEKNLIIDFNKLIELIELRNIIKLTETFYCENKIGADYMTLKDFKKQLLKERLVLPKRFGKFVNQIKHNSTTNRKKNIFKDMENKLNKLFRKFVYNVFILKYKLNCQNILKVKLTNKKVDQLLNIFYNDIFEENESKQTLNKYFLQYPSKPVFFFLLNSNRIKKKQVKALLNKLITIIIKAQ